MNNSNAIIETVRGIQAVPVDDVLLRDRKLFLTGPVTDESCNALISNLLYLESEDSSSPITLVINSPGGEVTSGLAVYDTIRLMKSPVYAVVCGIAASMGAIIYLAAEKDRRLMLPSSRIMIHDCSFGKKDIGGMKPFQIHEELSQLEKTNERLVSILAERCEKTPEEIAEVTRFDTYFDADGAKEFGLCSGVIDTDNFSTIMTKGA